MGETNHIDVWFVCKFCSVLFRQVDEFIEHKKEEHFAEFQKTSCIIFDEREPGILIPLITSSEEHLLANENNEERIKIEVTNDSPIIPFNTEIVNEPNLSLVKTEPNSELTTYENETKPETENNDLSLQQPEQNPYVLIRRLTFKEIQMACNPRIQSGLLKCEQKNFAPNSSDVDSTIISHVEVQNLTAIQPTETVLNIPTEHDLQLQCKLCSTQFETDAHLKIHVEICALDHKDRNRFCVTCNRKFFHVSKLRDHRLGFHGTEEEKLSVYKFKCHLCPKQYTAAHNLKYHLESHNTKTQQGKHSRLSMFRTPLKCSQPNCDKEFRFNSRLRVHVATVHLGVRRFSCPFPYCNKTFKWKANIDTHLPCHTGERPYKCTVDNCGKDFTTLSNKLQHQRVIHGIL